MNDDLFTDQPWLNDHPRHRRRGGRLAFSALAVAVGAVGAAALTAAAWLPTNQPTCTTPTPLPTVTVTTYVTLTDTPNTRPGLVFPVESAAELRASEPTWKGPGDVEQ